MIEWLGDVHESGIIENGWISFEWGESVKSAARRARLRIGPLLFEVHNEPKNWMPPHSTLMRVTVHFDYFGWFDIRWGWGEPVKKHRELMLRAWLRGFIASIKWSNTPHWENTASPELTESVAFRRGWKAGMKFLDRFFS